MRLIGESPIQKYTSYIFEIVYVTNSVTERMYSPEAVAHIVIRMHLSLTYQVQYELHIFRQLSGTSALRPALLKSQCAGT